VDTVAFCRNELTVPLQNSGMYFEIRCQLHAKEPHSSGRDTSNVEKPYCDWLDPICFPAQEYVVGHCVTLTLLVTDNLEAI